MKAVFGNGIVKYFMEPYNRKVWGIPLNLLSKNWIGERISVVDLARIEKNIAESRDDVGWGPNSTFRFPKYGGTGAIFQNIAKTFAHFIQLDHDVVRVDLDRKELHFAAGRKTTYDALITTIPLDLFIDKCIKVPDEVKGSAANLVHNSGLIVGLGFEGQRIDSKCWMYFPEDNSPFYRVTNFFNYSPYNVPDGDIKKYFSLMCETTYSSYKAVNKDTIIKDTVIGLKNSGMIHADEARHIVSRYLIDIPYAYPAPTLERDKALNVILPFLESRNVYSRGRFGAWKYEVGNMDHSFMQGVEVVERILYEKEEKTLHGIV
jgi:protoporphyrinogen oxidase